MINKHIGRKAACLACFAWLLAATAIEARGAVTEESAEDLAATQKRLEEVLEKIDPGNHKAEEETDGFAFHIENGFFSPFHYDIYGGQISSKNKTNILRIEGPLGEAETLARMLEQENLFKNIEHLGTASPVTLESKSHIIGQSLNIVAPWLSVLYTSSNSPMLTTNQTWFRFMTYLCLDLAVVAIGGTSGFRTHFDSAQNGTGIAAGLVLIRLFSAGQTMNLTRGHNRAAELKYTFYLD